MDAFLQNSEDFVIVETLSSAELAVPFCQVNAVDLVIMDIVMTVGISGIEATARIKNLKPKTKVILVTSMPEVSYLKKAKDAGADSLWYKEFEEQPLLAVMERTMKGENIYPDTTPNLFWGNASSIELTESEMLVLRKVISGKTDQEISDDLHISVWTARTHIQHMLQKTGCKNRVELAVNARATGLIIE